MNYIQFDFKIADRINSDSLLAVLANLSFSGFEETDTLLKAFIPEDDFDETMIDELKTFFPGLNYDRTLVKNINWNAAWEANFKPVFIDDFVGIRAHFHQPLKEVTHEIIITPKMSFGTGHHATTHMMVELIKELDLNNKSVIDFGTGTGVLAILAKKANAGVVVAVDYDDWSMENAKENFEQNHTTGIELIKHNTLPENRTFDVILANINLNVILRNMEIFEKATNVSGTLLLSGFLADDLPAIKKSLLLNKLIFEKSTQKSAWIAIKATKISELY